MKKALLITIVFLLLAIFASASEINPAKTYQCLMYAYSSEKSQTDGDPSSTASGTKCHWGTVAANHLKFKTKIKIQGFGNKIFIVEDRHHPKHKNIIDIWFPSKQEAKKFGVKKLRYWIVKE